MVMIARHGRAEVHAADWRELLEVVKDRGGADTLIVDAPYSPKTHSGHDKGAAYEGKRRDGRKVKKRRAIAYDPWSPHNVHEFVVAWVPWIRGWIVPLTDSELGPYWARSLASCGHYVFPPIPCVERNATVRRCGGGPSSWTTWAIPARPRSRRMARWRTTDGAYWVERESKPEIGGKPIELMRQLVRDYSDHGDLVVDPCCGSGGTTLGAALYEGRIALGGDVREEAAQAAAERLMRIADQVRPVPAIPSRDGTLPLFGELRAPRLEVVK